jgi:hypothetical protein
MWKFAPGRKKIERNKIRKKSESEELKIRIKKVKVKEKR